MCVADCSVVILLLFRLEYMETSAESGLNVTRAVDTLLDMVMCRMERGVDEAMTRYLGRVPDSITVGETNNHQSLCQC